MVTFRSVSGREADMELLLQADPDKEKVQAYIDNASIYEIWDEDTRKGCLVSHQHSSELVEFLNISVYPAYQQKGYGQRLLQFGLEQAREQGCRHAMIATGNSSISQLYLYQKMGFEINHIVHNYFPKNYPDPIVENGIQCKHLIILGKEL